MARTYRKWEGFSLIEWALIGIWLVATSVTAWGPGVGEDDVLYELTAEEKIRAADASALDNDVVYAKEDAAK